MDPYHSQRGMMMPLVLAILLIVAAVIGARYAGHSPVPEATVSPTTVHSEPPSVMLSPTPEPSVSLPPHALVSEYELASYINAVKTGKLVVLYYYANWCADCTTEFPKLQAAIATLADPKIAVFRVNYNDSDTDDDEKAAAKTFGVTTQNTVVIVKDGRQAFHAGAPMDYQATIAQQLQ